MAGDYTIKRIDEFEEMEGSGGATWRLARKAVDAKNFGFNVVDIEPGGQIPEHNESESGQEEIYIVLEGDGTMVTDDQEHPAPAGTFCRYSPETKRTVRNKSEAPIRVLLIGVPENPDYEPIPWA